MSDAGLGGASLPPRPRARLSGWTRRLAARPGFQSWASRFFLTRGIARREGEALFDLVAGFVNSQVLMALVELGVLQMLLDRPMTAPAIALRAGLDPHRARVLARAGAALGLLRLKRGERFALTRRGAALLGVPGLEQMIRHHRAFYRDLEDPVGFLRDGSDTELARFWPYVFGEGAEVDPERAAIYSELMADSQALVAEETLRAVSFRGSRCLMDVGGGSGAFLAAVLDAYPELKGRLLDLPQVAPAAAERFAHRGLTGRVEIRPASFRDGPLPEGADTISLVRVLYDHPVDVVRVLLARSFEALPVGGRIVVSEPMTGGDAPSVPGDTYFAFYTMAMGTGCARSAAEIGALLSDAGFSEVKEARTARPFITGVVTARKSL